MEPGPVDPSMLYLQPRHRTSSEAYMMVISYDFHFTNCVNANICTCNVKQSEEADFTIDHSISLKKVISHHPRVLEEIDQAGFSTVLRLGYL